MDTINQCFIENIIKAEENEKNVNLVDFKISAKAVGDGNNVSSEVSRLYVNYEKDGKVIKKTYFMKIPSSSPLYHILKPFGIYEKECNMYTTVLPAMHKLLDEQERLSPKCYVTSDLKILILEDLRESGYKMINRRRQMDFDHATAALRTLAKFHAVSVKLNEMHPQIINLVKKDGFYDSKNTDLVVKSYERFLNIAQNIPSVEPEVYSKLVQIKDRIWDIVIEQTTPRENALNVLNHGDFWSNNMLFKYDHDGIKVKLVDFQLCRWSSPANDIIFMIINSVRFEVFEKKLDALLSAYHESFSYWLRSLKCNETYTLAELKKDFHNSYQYGYNVMASVLPLVMKKATDLNLNENVKNNKVNSDGLKKIFEEEKYIVAVTKWIHFYAKNDLFL